MDNLSIASEFEVTPREETKAILSSITVQPELIQSIIKDQTENKDFLEKLEKWKAIDSNKWGQGKDGEWRYLKRIVVPTESIELKESILKEAHRSQLTIHPGNGKMYQDLKRSFWWEGMKKDIAQFVARCSICQQIKAEHQRPAGLLQPLPVPGWKWEHISMDFIVGLPKTIQNFDAIWVVDDRLSKSAHFIPYNMKYTMDKLGQLYIQNIVRLHGVPVSIVSDRDPRFTSRFWQSLQNAMGTKLHKSTSNHPQTDGQTERVNQVIEDMLRACVLEFQGSWERYMPLAEFAYNNSYHASIGMAPFEALYGRPCRSPTCWAELGDVQLLGPDLVQETSEKIALIREKMKTAQSRQKSYADKRRRDLEFEVGDKVWLKISPIRGLVQYGKKKGKLSPRYVGPFEILERIGKVAYRLALPTQLAGIHDVFHVSMLRKYVVDPTHVISYDGLEINKDVSYKEKPIKIVDRMVKKLRRAEIALVKVQWNNHDEREASWELESEMREKFPQLFSST